MANGPKSVAMIFSVGGWNEGMIFEQFNLGQGRSKARNDRPKWVRVGYVCIVIEIDFVQA